jgi:hypothetical protein
MAQDITQLKDADNKLKDAQVGGSLPTNFNTHDGLARTHNGFKNNHVTLNAAFQYAHGKVPRVSGTTLIFQ